MSDQSTHIRQPKSLRAQLEAAAKARRTACLFAGATAAALTGAAHAQDTQAPETEESQPEVIYVFGLPGVDYRSQNSGDARRSAPIADTPVTLTTITQEALNDAGTTDLRETLSRQPGITLGTGENGNAFGDRYVIRGFEARSDVFVDGLRDPGMTIRETFAVEQIEITKGPSSTFAGRGSTGGAVNSITKQANPDASFTEVELGLGTDDYRRATVDANIPLGMNSALRINAVHGFEEVPDRGPAERERNGLAASLNIGATDRLSFITDFYYLDAAGDTDLGSYILPNGSPVHDIPVYLQDEDFLDSRVMVGTFKTIYELAPNFRIENTLRYGETENGYVVTGARGNTRAASDPLAPGAASIGLSTHQGWQEVEYTVDQANAFWDAQLFGREHAIVLGFEYSDLNVINGVFNVTNTGATNCVTSGRGGDQPGYCLLDENGAPVADPSSLLGRDIVRGGQDSDYQVETLSLYVMDTVSLTENLDLFAGIRLDSFDYANDVVSRGNGLSYAYSDQLWNGHLGVVYHFTDTANAYFTISSSSNINGGESDVGANCGYGGLCGAPDEVGLGDPEDTINLELGTKWDLMDESLLLTAAAFHITKSNVMEGVRGVDYSTLGTLNTGEIEVVGVEFSATGNLTEAVSIQAGVTFMSSEITDSADASVIGSELANFADSSAYLQLRYDVTDAFGFGGAITYRGEMGAGQPDSAASSTYVVPAYTTLDLFAEYEFGENYGLRLNIGNVTDEDYYTAAYRSGAFAYKGDAFNARLTLSAVF